MPGSTLAQDPSERFDIVRADGTATGTTKSRSAVHRDGDWHRAMHVWIMGEAADGRPFLLFQHRSLDKDSWPGRLDATVGGHVGAGESLTDALRETEEEVGVSVSINDLIPLGTRVSVNETETGLYDHELQSVYLLRDNRPLSAYRPHPVELLALVQLPLLELRDLLAAEQGSLRGHAVAPGSDRIDAISVELADFIPSVDRYFYRIAIAAASVARGERHVAV